MYLNGMCPRAEENPGGGIKHGLAELWEKVSFKDQASEILRKLHTIKPPATAEMGPSCVVPDSSPIDNQGIQRLERDILFSTTHAAAAGNQADLSFMHNDLSRSKCIVNDGKIVAVVDWKMAGFFGWKTASDVQVRIRSPRRENYAHLNLPELFLEDILFWNDLYSEQL
ncbi:hypothetical protein QQS21_009484 [Conoideocrella luteorostrata]|uniref:Aminoglycoside phosphotransferase domain-containing protein n=1 Tax=Conoideocrella luteorostrata TaxID=1105319 RepID=A0AAJ0CGX7_9HYPO|nr:hypothetical protein QQS21_009484 [Conoideocrella luteorostrata]